jgi:hypothetical protein
MRLQGVSPWTEIESDCTHAAGLLQLFASRAPRLFVTGTHWH